MKLKSRIALALMAGIGLATMGNATANAQSTHPSSHITSTTVAQKTSSVHHYSSHSLNNKLLSHKQYNRVSHYYHVFKNNHSHLPIINRHQNLVDYQLDSNDKKTNNSHNNKLSLNHDHNKAAKGNQNQVKKNRPNHSKTNQKKIRKSVAHFDNNPANIDGMNRFVQHRHHYLYPKIGGNTRDLGGYMTQNHKYRVQRDRIIRSADLDKLSKSGVNALKALHVNKIIDLRYYQGKNGIQGHPDPNELNSKILKATNIDYQRDPVYTHTEARQFEHYMIKHNLRGEYYFYGSLSVSKPQAIRTYRKVFHDLLQNRHGAILFHCNLGRDRTGVTSALILSALGVNRNLIYHDYLLTDHYHYKYAKSQPYTKQAAELQYFFKTIDKKYGSVNNYLSKEIGLNHTKLMQLRKMYLVRR